MSEALTCTNTRTEILKERDDLMRKAYNKLKCEEQIVNFQGRRIAIKLNYGQVVGILAKTYFLSARRVEFILGQTEPKMAPLNPSNKTTSTVATGA
jgi:hypothetical protein